MQSIILQQLELHFGEDFKEIYNNTRSYVKGLIGKNWWIDSRALIQSEGPLSRMVEDCLSHVIDKGDKEKGWQAYTSYLTSFYGSTKADAKAIGVVYAADESKIRWSTLGEREDNLPQSLRDNPIVEDDMSDQLTLFDEEQADFIQVYSRMGAAAAGETFDMSQEQARTRRNTIKRTVKRRLDNMS